MWTADDCDEAFTVIHKSSLLAITTMASHLQTRTLTHVLIECSKSCVSDKLSSSSWTCIPMPNFYLLLLLALKALQRAWSIKLKWGVIYMYHADTCSLNYKNLNKVAVGAGLSIDHRYMLLSLLYCMYIVISSKDKYIGMKIWRRFSSMHLI